MNQYTKGEWKVEQGYNVETALGDGKLITDDTGLNIAIALNDAHLLAAAPAMYEALFIGLDLVKQTLYQHPDDEIAQAQKAIIDKALAKASGG